MPESESPAVQELYDALASLLNTPDLNLAVNAGEKVWRVAERKCDTVTRLKPAEWRVSILLLSFACGLPSFETAL